MMRVTMTAALTLTLALPALADRGGEGTKSVGAPTAGAVRV